MSKVVSQETFDNLVKENLLDFSMTPQEAKDESIKILEAQGVNLSNIIQDLSLNEETGQPIMNEAMENLKKHISGEEKLNYEKLKYNLQIIDSESKKSIPHRVLAAKTGAHEILLSILDDELSNNNNQSDIILYCLEAANSLTNKQPDIFDAEALSIIIKILQTKNDDKIICLTLQWMGKACIMHEMNRQNIINADILKYLKPLIFLNDSKILSDTCAVFRYLILDDDIRVEFGNAHQHARAIANEVLLDLTKLLSEYDERNIVCDLIRTITALTVRHEFCLSVANAGGLKRVLECLSENPNHIRLNLEGLKFLRALAGHDTVKAQIIQQNAAPIIRDILINHKSNTNVIIAALVCVSSLSLRNQNNSLEFFNVDLPDIIIEIMQLHPENAIIQRNAAWTIRNMVSRLRTNNENFLNLGAEELLNTAMKKHPNIEQDCKAALRDLGCKVHLKEEWTGKADKKISN